MSSINLPAILIANGLGAWLVGVLLLSERRCSHNVSLDRIFFLMMCRLNFFLCLLETVAFLVDGRLFYGARAFSLGINTIVFLMNIGFASLWACYADFKLFGDSDRLRKRLPWLLAPALCIAILCIVNLYAEFFFAVSADNIYSRRPLVFIVYGVTYLYLMYGVYLAFRYKRQVDHYLFFPVATFLTPVLVGSVVQFLFYGLALIWPSVAVGLTALHTNLQNEQSSLDALTGLYNRNYLMHYMGYATRQIQRGHRMAGLLLDMDNFKQINDVYGHSAGDAVLRTVGELLHRVTSPHAVAVRYGGDEFVILVPDATPEQMNALLETLKHELAQYNAAGRFPCAVSFSIGTAETDSTRFDAFFRSMDHSMYGNKRKAHTSNASPRLE